MQDFFRSQITKSRNQFVRKFPDETELWIKREDLLHPEVSGNKFRKLKYNLIEARNQNVNTILTFGGAFSNHLAATAAAGKMFNFKTIGVVRGEELGENPGRWSSTLQFCDECGMEFHFVSREDYRNKESQDFAENLHLRFGDFYLLPEGGTNRTAIKGCEEILTEEDKYFDYICASVGTGGTISGIINSSESIQRILGFSALKTDYLKAEIEKNVAQENWDLNQSYHFGGYAKINIDLVNFINEFHEEYGILLDPIYTGKMIFGIFDLVKKDYFPSGSKILCVHTGGLQGIDGMNQFLMKKKMPQIKK